MRARVRPDLPAALGESLEIRPPKGFAGRSFEDFMQLGMIITALPAVNAIPAVCAAAPGIRTYAELPLVTGRGFLIG